MKRYILTGPPGAGKTMILRGLAARGHAVVEEAATDVIEAELARGHDEPWREPSFVETIVALQRQRQEERAPAGVQVQVFDRSPVCTLALAQYIQHPTSAVLTQEIDRLTSQGIYENRVFFVRPLGFTVPTAVRRISYEDSLRFEVVHEAAYRSLGFTVVDVPPGDVAVRVAMVESRLRSWT